MPDHIITPSQMLHEIDVALKDAYTNLAEVEAEIRSLLAAGVFTAVPRLDWQKKAGKDYLYLWFPRSKTTNGWTGPGGKQKLYVGRDARKVALARGMVNRTKRAIELTRAKERLQRWITERELEVWRIHRTITNVPTVSLDATKQPYTEVSKWRIRH